jgi:hypothetical protein
LSTDLLRRAAAKLREHAIVASDGPWHVEYLGRDRYPQRVSNPAAVIVAEMFDGPPAQGTNAEYIALMHPPVAQTLADLLDRIADISDFNGHDPTTYPDSAVTAVARVVLREEVPA